MHGVGDIAMRGANAPRIGDNCTILELRDLVACGPIEQDRPRRAENPEGKVLDGESTLRLSRPVRRRFENALALRQASPRAVVLHALDDL